MPLSVHRTDNKASSGVNEDGQSYCDSNLNSSPPKQPAKDLLSSLTPPNHNQARNAVDGASANTNTPSVRQSTKRAGRGRRSAKHGRKRSRTTNVCPGSAASSSNANAANTGPVEDECDNKENCSPLEESWRSPIKESWPTALKSTLVVLDACLIPDHGRRAVIALFIADAQSEPLNEVKSAILKWLTVLGGDDKGKKYKAEVGVARRRLAKVLESIANGKYRGRVNLGDGLQDILSLIILKHYAPYSCKGYTDGGEYNLIDRDNVCIKAFHLLIARSLHKEGGEVWTDDVAKSVNDNIAFTDLRVILPNRKDTHQKEFNTFAKDCDISSGLCDLIGFLGYASQVKYHYLLHGTPVKVIVASAECNRVWFDERARTATPYVIFLSYVPHGQCWAMRLPLMNCLVHRDEMLPRYNERLVAAFEGIVVTPAVSMITHRFGARTGNDLDDGELIAKMEIMRQWCIKGGNVTKDAWKAVFGGKATEKQEQLVYNSPFYILMMAWAAFNDGHADNEQMELLEKDHSYKTKMAWKAFDNNYADDEQKSLLEGSYFYKLKMAWKAFDENRADDEQKELLENHPFYQLNYKLKMAWAAFYNNDATPDQMKLLAESQNQFYKTKMAWKALDNNCATPDQMELLHNNIFYRQSMAARISYTNDDDWKAAQLRSKKVVKYRKKKNALISTTISQLIYDPVEHDTYSLGEIMKKQGFTVRDSFNMELQEDIQRQVAEGKRKSGALVAPVTAVTKPRQPLQNLAVSSNSFVVLSPGVNGACNDRQLLKGMTFYFAGMFVDVDRTQKTAHGILASMVGQFGAKTAGHPTAKQIDYIVAGEHTRKNIIEKAKLRSISVITKDRLQAILLGEVNIVKN